MFKDKDSAIMILLLSVIFIMTLISLIFTLIEDDEINELGQEIGFEEYQHRRSVVFYSTQTNSSQSVV